jgi:seryl-tRNA synthetase
MLDLKFIRENPDKVKQATAAKNQPVDIDAFLKIDGERRDSINQADKLKNLRNVVSKEIAELSKAKKQTEADAKKAEMKIVADDIKKLDEKISQTELTIAGIQQWIPNIPHASVPHGQSAADNKIVGQWGEQKSFPFIPKDHMDLGATLDILDFPRGAKIAGAGFPVYKGNGALLERALITFFLDLHATQHGYREIFPPFLVNSTSAFGTGQLPKSQDQMYYIKEDDLYCIPTAEVPVTNLHRDEILNSTALPVKYCAYSACFRREAGSYGKDTKGFLRVHEFNKVELVKLTTPETSYQELETLRADAESVLKALGLCYRVVALCDADLSFAAAKCYDLEAWAPAEKKWLEVSSCSNFEDFQARRINIRYRPNANEKPAFVHTLNGSGLATSRVLVALMETYQTERGTIMVPEVLQPYMRGSKEIS